MEHAQALLSTLSGPTGYALFFLIITSCCIGAPFNSDFMFISSSVLAAMGYFNLSILMILGFIALLFGDSINFFFARKFGKKLLKVKPFSWVVSESKVTQAEQLIHRHGLKFMFIVRFIPLIRTVLFFTAGTLHVPVKTFYVMNALATLIYLPTIMVSAYTLADNIDVVLKGLQRFQVAVVTLITIFLLTFVLLKVKKQLLKRQRSTK